MSLAEEIGAHLAVGIPGTAATLDVLDHLRAIHAQSLVVFARNFTSVNQFKLLLEDLHQSLGRRLFVMIDHEGGRVIRFSDGVTRFPSAKEMAARGPKAVEEQGKVEAKELRALGVHANLAPCADVLMDGCDPVIGDRSYGSQPDLVSACVRARIHGLQHHHGGLRHQGVSACAKHFPGLGSILVDPHKTLPTVRLSWEEMEEIDLAPFEEAVAAGVEMVMSSHVCYPGLGEPSGQPATFSRRLIQGLLRERLSFQGLVLTDDLDMGALQKGVGAGESAVRAVEAGHDLLLLCADLQAQLQAYQALTEAYQSGRLPPSGLASTVDRLHKVAEKSGLRP